MQAHFNSTVPLATRMRPRSLDEFIGQTHLTGPSKPLCQAIEAQRLHSMIFWGPPGTGKTTLAELLAQSMGASVQRLSAVLSGVKEIRAVIEQAHLTFQQCQQATVLFVDEVHRFNKAQQDVFLPHIEQGVLILIGATTENPSFELNNALLSRLRVYVLKPLTSVDLTLILEAALQDELRGLGKKPLILSAELKERIVLCADGDARQCLNLLEIAADFSELVDGHYVVPDQAFQVILESSTRRFDHKGEFFYDQISALHKAIRGSDPDASLYWLCRMLEGGCDPLYIARRIVRVASEDIGNADPRALDIGLQAWHVYERLGSPEGELALAQAVVYMACAAKSNAVYKAFNAAMTDAKRLGSLEVPMYLRNAPTKLMQELGYHKGYRYAHDEPDAFAKGVHYFPESLAWREYYTPVARGLEIKIREKLNQLRELNRNAQSK